MNKRHFTEDDTKKIVEFLNFIAKNAKFTLDTTEVINYFHLLSHMQKEIIPKIDEHILEVKKVIENKED